MTEQERRILQADWYATLLRRALREAPTVEDATAAADLALSIQPYRPGAVALAFEIDAEFARTPQRQVGEKWQGPSGRWFTKNQAGRVVPYKPPEGTHEAHRWKMAKEEKVKQASTTAEEKIRTLAAVKDLSQVPARELNETVKGLAQDLKKMTVEQLNALKKQLGVKASGAKKDLAQKIAQRALAKVREGAEKPVEAPTPAPAPEPAPAQPATPEPGFTGIDAIGHRWVNGVQVAIGEEKPVEAPTPVETPAPPVDVAQPEEPEPSPAQQAMNAEIDRVHQAQDAFFTGQPGTMKQFQDELAKLQEAINQTQSPRKEEAQGYIQTIARGLAGGAPPPEPEIPQQEVPQPEPEAPKEEPKAEAPPSPPRPVGPGLYADLEVPKDATLDEIKKAYRKQILRWHPDRNPGGDEAELGRKVSRITEAFAVLGDENKRAQYDTSGTVRTSTSTSSGPSRQPAPEPPEVSVPKGAGRGRKGVDPDLVKKVAERARWLADAYERYRERPNPSTDPDAFRQYREQARDDVRQKINNMAIQHMSREELNDLAKELYMPDWRAAKRVSNKKLADEIRWNIYNSWATPDESEQKYWNKSWKWV